MLDGCGLFPAEDVPCTVDLYTCLLVFLSLFLAKNSTSELLITSLIGAVAIRSLELSGSPIARGTR